MDRDTVQTVTGRSLEDHLQEQIRKGLLTLSKEQMLDIGMCCDGYRTKTKTVVLETLKNYNFFKKSWLHGILPLN